MSDKYNRVKSEQLGMSLGKANARLRKKILFDLVKKCNLDFCYRCNEKIEKIEDLSIEHKIHWLHSENPKELFFDLGNIAFSHLKCNVLSNRYRYNRKIEYISLVCKICKKRFEREKFQFKSKSNIGQIDFYCSKNCAAKDKGKGYGRRNYE